MTPAAQRLLDTLGIDLPVVQAPMAGVSTPELAAAVADGGRPGLDRRRRHGCGGGAR